VSAPLVSVIVALAGPEGRPREVIDAVGRSLTAGGYACEFVVVIDGPGHRFDGDLRDVAARWPVRVVQLEGGGLGESSTCRRTCRSSPTTSSPW
jgi:hypothetical protein